MPGVVGGYEADGRLAVVEVEGGAILRIRHTRPLAAGARVKVLCKPEQLRLTPDGDLSGRLSAVAYLGSVIQYQVEVGSCSLEVVMPAEAPVHELGAVVGVAVRGEQLRLIEV